MFFRYSVEVFKLAYVVCAHPPVLACCCIAGHSALVVAAKQTFHVELKEIPFLFFVCKEYSCKRLFPPDHPRIDSRLERTGLASTDRLARVLFALDALDAFQDFLSARRRLADLPADLRSFRPDASPPKRIRHRSTEGDRA